MEDNGARSNPLETGKALLLERLVGLKSLVSERSELRRSPGTETRLRQGAVLAAVSSLLEVAEAPMRYSEIRIGVEVVLRRPVPASSVRQALSAHSRGSGARFRRVGRGLYVLAGRDEEPPER